VVYLEKEDSSESVYTSAQLIPALGDVFKLEVLTSASDEPIVAVDSICSTVVPFRLASTGVNVDDRNMSVSIRRTGIIRFLPVGSEDLQYYELNVYVENIDEDLPDSFWREHRVTLTSSTSIVTSEDYYPSKTAIASYNPHALLFKCNSGNDSVSVDFVYGSIMIGSSAGWKSCAHNLRVELRQVSYAYYKFATAWAKQENAMIGDILYGGAPPVLIPSNVENGTGVFAGYNATEYKTFIEKYIYEKQY